MGASGVPKLRFLRPSCAPRRSRACLLRAPTGRGERAEPGKEGEEGGWLCRLASSSPRRVQGGADPAASRRGSALERRSASDRPAPPCPKWSPVPWFAPTRATGRNTTMARSRSTSITASADRWCWSWVSQARDPPDPSPPLLPSARPGRRAVPRPLSKLWALRTGC